MGRDVHRRLLRHVPEDAFASHASAAGAFDAPDTYAVQYHYFSPHPSSSDGARETPSFRDNPRVSSSSSHAASASGAANTVTVFMFILLPVVFLVHCCCCGTRADTFDPGGVDWGRRRRRVGARERRGRLAGGPSRGGTASHYDGDGFDLEGGAALSARGSRSTANDDTASDAVSPSPTALSDDETPGPASNATITSLPRCTAGDGDWASLLVDGEKTAACSVCCDDIERGQDVRVMACAHAFHAGCIRTWLKVSGSCPACRQPAKRLAAEDREAFWRARRRASLSEGRSPPPSQAAGDDADGDDDDASAGDAETRREPMA